MDKRKIVQRGAEAVLWIDSEGSLVKERIEKGYRIPQIDRKIRKSRTKGEIRLLERAMSAGVDVPRIRRREDFSIAMEFVDGKKVKDILDRADPGERNKIADAIGKAAGRLHAEGIFHGDLTTSNMIWNRKLFLIDFGLGKFSGKVEDQAVDLFLLQEAIRAAHFRVADEVWKRVIKVYSKSYSNSSRVVRRTEQIARRRRYKKQ